MECSDTVPTHLNTCSVLPFFIYINLLLGCDFSCRGILAIAWSMADSELLLSCGKDAKILCSNPNTGEVLYSRNLLKSQSVWRLHSGTCKGAFLKAMDFSRAVLHILAVCASLRFHCLRRGRSRGWIFVRSPRNYAAVGCFSMFTCG